MMLSKVDAVDVDPLEDFLPLYISIMMASVVCKLQCLPRYTYLRCLPPTLEVS